MSHGCHHCVLCTLERIEHALQRRLERIEYAIARLEPIMARTDQVLQQISTGLTGLEEDVQRLISAAGELDEEGQAAADSILARLASLNEAADTAVPPRLDGSEGGQVPSDENAPPAGEGTNISPDAPVAPEDENEARPTS